MITVVTNEIATLLATNSYPGRGIIIGKHQDGVHAVIAYFIMGRSENSRNRIFLEREGGVRTMAYEPAKLTDPTLIIYAPVRVITQGGKTVTIVTNGDQSITIYKALESGKSFEDALHRHSFEPDAPNFTPRISGILSDFAYKLAILKSAGGNPESTERFFYEYEAPVAGVGHFLHTYRCDGNPIPSFEGDPVPVYLNEDIDSFTNTLWKNLNSDNKISLFTRYINVVTGEVQSRIKNKNRQGANHGQA